MLTDSDSDSSASRWTSPRLGAQWSENTTPARDPTPAQPGTNYRAPYPPEQLYWIWFHTTDFPLIRRRYHIDGLQRKFNAQWPGRERNLGGLQCRLYRLMGDCGLPKRRAQKGPGGRIDARKFGMWTNTRHRFRWMDQYANRLPGKSAKHWEILFASDPITGYVLGDPYCEEDCGLVHSGSPLER